MDRRRKVELFEEIRREHAHGDRSHWGFQTEFCNPARGNEKGGVEGEVGYFRRNHLVPVPRVESLEELNKLLLAGCRADEQRRIAGKPHTVGEAMGIEREHLLPLPAEGFELAEISFPVVDSKGCVKARTNCYADGCSPGPEARMPGSLRSVRDRPDRPTPAFPRRAIDRAAPPNRLRWPPSPPPCG